MDDEGNLKSWAAEPDVCRCCLSTNGSLDLTVTYVNGEGIGEVFADILKECFGISLSHLSEWDPCRLLCSLCAAHIRDASAFRRQVLRAKSCYEEYSRKGTKPVNEEDEHNLDCEFVPDISSDLEVDHKNEEKKCEKTSSKGYNKIQKICKRAQAEKRELIAPEPKIQKKISERKRVISTCHVVLRDTTACPFRHHKSWFQCFFCTQDFMEINLLRKHTAQNHEDIVSELNKMQRYPRMLQIEISNLECRPCAAILDGVEPMRRHFETVHNAVIYKECIADYKVDRSPFSCHLCDKEFHVFRTLTTHLNEHYANCICDVCGRSYINSKRLKVHKRTHENGHFPCHICGKVLQTKTSKYNHMESAHLNRTIKCQICFKPMKHYNARIKHMSEAHNITHKFKCKICSKEYNIKHYLATHMRQTHGNKNKKCSLCDMTFITNNGLKKHMTKHTGDKPHKCPVCEKSYARNYTLRDHMKVHET